MLDVSGDRRVAELSKVVTSPVPLQSRREKAVKGALGHGKWRGSNVVKKGPAQRAHRLESRLDLLRGSRATPEDAANLLQMKLLGEHRNRGNHHEGEKAVDLFGRLDDKLAVCSENFGACSNGQNVGPNWTIFTGWRRNLNDVTTPKFPPPPRTAQKRSGFWSALAVTKAAVGEHHIDGEQVVNGQAVAAGEIANASAQG